MYASPFLLKDADKMAEAFAEALAAITGDDGAPGFWVSMIPIYGSWVNLVYHWENGQYVWVVFDGAMLISDVFFVKAIFTGAARGLMKLPAALGRGGSGGFGLFGLRVRPGGVITPSMESAYVAIAKSPKFKSCMSIYNCVGLRCGQKPAANVVRLVQALRTETTFAKRANFFAAFFVPGQHPAATRFWIQGNPFSRYGPRAARHELLHMAAALNGQRNLLRHEFAVWVAATPEHFLVFPAIGGLIGWSWFKFID
jgi:hypothetical protein